MRIAARAGLSILLPLGAADARASENGAPDVGLRAAAARHLAALPLRALETPPAPLSQSETTCCPSGCSGARVASAGECGGRLDPRLGGALGVALGAGLGFGLGQGESHMTSVKQLRPFGLADSLITAGAVAVAWKGHELLPGGPPPLCGGRFSDCRDGKDALGGLDARIRRSLVWPSLRGRARAEALSNGTLLATLILPAAFLVGSDETRQGRELWLTVESAAVTTAILQVVKHRVHRPRPYVHYCEVGCDHDLGEKGTQLSFFSGHSAISFSVAVSMGTIASMRSYRQAPWVLGTGIALAGTTAYLRVAADQHYFTDVLVGAAVGSTIGWLVPRLHGTRDTPRAESASRAARPGPSLAVPVPLKGPGGGLWLHGSVGRQTGVLLSWRF